MAGQGADAQTSGYRERNSTADKALDILLMFSEQQLTLTAVEVSAHLGVARSTAYRYLQSLVASQFLEEADGGGFQLGRRVLELARLARKGIGLSEIARPVMRRVATEVGETVLLTRLAGSTVVCLEREDAAGAAVRISYERGQVLPSNAGASAYVLLAWLGPSEVDDVLANVQLRSFTERTLTTKKALLDRLEQTRHQGFAVSRGELDHDVLGVAAPVRDAEGRVVAAISVAALSARVPDDRLEDVAATVRAAADEISGTLSLRG